MDHLAAAMKSNDSQHALKQSSCISPRNPSWSFLFRTNPPKNWAGPLEATFHAFGFLPIWGTHGTRWPEVWADPRLVMKVILGNEGAKRLFRQAEEIPQHARHQTGVSQTRGLLF